MRTKIYCVTAITLCLLIGGRNIAAQVDASGGGKAVPVTKSKPRPTTKQSPKSVRKRASNSTTTAKTTQATPAKAASTVSRNATYYFDYALYNCGKDDLDCRLENFSRAISLAPQIPAPYYNRGLIYYRKKFYNSAIADYTKVIELDEPNAALAYNNRAWTFCEMGQYERALSDANRSLELKPNVAETLDTRGNAYMGNGEYRLALDDFDRAIKLAPTNPEMYKSRAKLFRRKGRIVLAEADERKIKELGGELQ